VSLTGVRDNLGPVNVIPRKDGRERDSNSRGKRKRVNHSPSIKKGRRSKRKK